MVCEIGMNGDSMWGWGSMGCEMMKCCVEFDLLDCLYDNGMDINKPRLG